MYLKKTVSALRIVDGMSGTHSLTTHPIEMQLLLKIWNYRGSIARLCKCSSQFYRYQNGGGHTLPKLSFRKSFHLD